MITRRNLISKSTAAMGGLMLSKRLQAAAVADLVASTEVQVLEHGTKLGGLGWFHPRACLVPSADGKSTVLMTMQEINGSDVFHQLYVITSDDLGRTWTEPKAVSDMDWHDKGGGLFEGVCDVVPQWHPQTKKVLAMGTNVYYRNKALTQASDGRWPVYVVRGADSTWGKRRKLEWDDPRASAIFSCGSSERLLFENGDVLVPVTFGPTGSKHRGVTTLRCAFDGKTLTVKEAGNELVNTVGRGLLEPSITRFKNRYYLTIRAEDGKGYVATSDDGLHWSEAKAWAWADGTPLVMVTTQQHWLTHSEGLHLAYNRRTEENAKVMRHRAPLFIAAVDHETLRLRRETERVLFPLKGDALNDPKHVTLTDNFHPLAVSPAESWITVGENTISSRQPGDLMIGRVKWSRPNGLV